MKDIASRSVATRTILIAVLIFNVLGIGLSEVQRRRLGQQSTEVVLQLRDIEQKRLVQQEVELDHTYKLIAEINRRVNNVEILVQSGPLASEIKDISERLKAVQVKIESSTVSK